MIYHHQLKHKYPLGQLLLLLRCWDYDKETIGGSTFTIKANTEIADVLLGITKQEKTNFAINYQDYDSEKIIKGIY